MPRGRIVSVGGVTALVRSSSSHSHILPRAARAAMAAAHTRSGRVTPYRRARVLSPLPRCATHAIIVDVPPLATHHAITACARRLAPPSYIPTRAPRLRAARSLARYILSRRCVCAARACMPTRNNSAQRATAATNRAATLRFRVAASLYGRERNAAP